MSNWTFSKRLERLEAARGTDPIGALDLSGCDVATLAAVERLRATPRSRDGRFDWSRMLEADLRLIAAIPLGSV